MSSTCTEAFLDIAGKCQGCHVKTFSELLARFWCVCSRSHIVVRITCSSSHSAVRLTCFTSQSLCTWMPRQAFLRPYTPISYRSLRSLSPGATPAVAMTHPGVLSLSPHMTFYNRPQEDKEIPPARAAQALLTLPPPHRGYLYQLIHESPTAGLLQITLPLSGSPTTFAVRLPYPSVSRTHARR